MFLFIIQSGGFRKLTIFHDYYYVNGMDLITFGKVISFLGENFSFVIIHITNKISDIRARNHSHNARIKMIFIMARSSKAALRRCLYFSIAPKFRPAVEKLTTPVNKHKGSVNNLWRRRQRRDRIRPPHED